jgi:hypothetical protein
LTRRLAFCRSIDRLDFDKLAATHRHGLLVLTLPMKDSVKPRRIQFEGVAEPQKQLTTV